MKDLTNLRNALAIHAMTGLPMYQWEARYADGRIEAGRVVVKHGEALIDPIAPGAWYWKDAQPSVLGVDPSYCELELCACEKPRVTIMFTGSGGNIFEIERRVDALCRDPKMGAWLNTHSGLPLRTAIAEHKRSSVKALIEGGIYPHAYDFMAIQHAVRFTDGAFVDWIFEHHPVESPMLDKKLVFSLQLALEDATTDETRLLDLIDALSRHQRLPGLWKTVVRDVVRSFSPAVLEALAQGGAMRTLDEQHGEIIRAELMKTVCTEVSDRYIEVLLDAGVDVSGFARAESLRDQRAMTRSMSESAQTDPGMTPRPAIIRRHA